MICRLRIHLVVAASLGLATGCGGEDDRPATWSYVHEAIIEPSCATASCHSEMAATDRVDLEDREGAYELLVGRPCSSEPPDPEEPRKYVAPEDPGRSKLMELLRGDDVPVPMPPDRALPDGDVELVASWIQDGALCD